MIVIHKFDFDKSSCSYGTNLYITSKSIPEVIEQHKQELIAKDMIPYVDELNIIYNIENKKYEPICCFIEVEDNNWRNTINKFSRQADSYIHDIKRTDPRKAKQIKKAVHEICDYISKHNKKTKGHNNIEDYM